MSDGGERLVERMGANFVGVGSHLIIVRWLISFGQHNAGTLLTELARDNEWATGIRQSSQARLTLEGTVN